MLNKFLVDIHSTFSKLNTEPKIVLDIGSFSLTNSMKMRAAYPNARILAFDPVPSEPYHFDLQKTAKDHNIELFKFGFSDENNEEIDFYFVTTNADYSSLLEPIDNYGDDIVTTKINVRRLDSFLEEISIDKVDVMFLDTGGTELRILKGMGTYLDSVKCILSATNSDVDKLYHDEDTEEELKSFLHDNQFITRSLRHNGSTKKSIFYYCIRKDLNHMESTFDNMKKYTFTLKLTNEIKSHSSRIEYVYVSLMKSMVSKRGSEGKVIYTEEEVKNLILEAYMSLCLPVNSIDLDEKIKFFVDSEWILELNSDKY